MDSLPLFGPAGQAEPVSPVLKRCRKCEEWKPATAFSFRRDQGRLLARCRACVSASVRERRDKDPEKYRAMQTRLQKAYQARNRDKIKARAAAWYAANRELTKARAREWGKANPEKKRATKRRRRERDPEGVRAYFRQYRRDDPEADRERRKRYEKKHPETLKAHRARGNARYRSRKKATVNDLTTDQWQAILDVQRGRCLMCDRRFSKRLPPTRDHVIPVSQGGGLTASNTAALCRRCNSRKQDRMIDLRSEAHKRLFPRPS